MNSDIMTVLAKFIAIEILSQPSKKIAADEKLISSGLNRFPQFGRYCVIC